MNQQLIDLKNKLTSIADLIQDKNDVFYLDYPLHLNVGDLLIYHGTEQFFTDHNIRVTLKRSEFDVDIEELKQKITPHTTILLHGGGNFGDLYPQHQKIREMVVQTFPNNRVIVLPQTLFYKSQETLEKSAHFLPNIRIVIYWRETKERQKLLNSFRPTCIYHRTWRMNCTEHCRRKTHKAETPSISCVKTSKPATLKKILRHNSLQEVILKTGKICCPNEMI